MNGLQPASKVQKETPITGFDIETTGEENRFLMGSLVGDGCRRGAPEVFWDRQSMLEELLSGRFRSGLIFAHNLEFDLLGLLQGGGYDWLQSNGYDLEIFHNGSAIIHAKIRDQSDHVWELRDSGNVAMHVGVEDMGGMIDLPKLGTEENPLQHGGEEIVIDFEEQDAADFEQDLMETYNVRDSKICYEFMKWIRSQIHELGGTLEVTAAKTAVDLFKQEHLTSVIEQPERDMLEKSYEAYYGGRVSPLQKGKTDGPVYEYDVASLYPYCMTQCEFPQPGSLQYDRGNGKYTLETQRERIWEAAGQSKVTVRAPESMEIPVLPTKWEDKLLFPIGTITDWWTHNELRFALERGYVIEEVHEQLYTQHTFNPFEGYVQELFEKRLQCRDNSSPMEFVVKLMMNSLYGKFGQQIEMDSGGLFKRQKDASTDELIGSRVVGDWYVEPVEYGSDNPDSNGLPGYINPIIASYVTARGRMELYRWFEYAQERGANVLYCDTDSIWIDQQLEFDEEKRLGEMDYEGSYDSLYVFGPKMYVADSAEKTKTTMKGIPHGEMDTLWEALQAGETRVDYTKIASMREGFRSNEFAPLEVVDQHKEISITGSSKRLNDQAASHDRMLSEQISTQPFDLNDLQQEVVEEQAGEARRKREQERSASLKWLVEDDEAHADSELSAAENRQQLWENRKQKAREQFR